MLWRSTDLRVNCRKTLLGTFVSFEGRRTRCLGSWALGGTVDGINPALRIIRNILSFP